MAAPVNLKDLTIDNITENVHAINSQCSNLRLKYILERVVTHLHDLARETRLTTDEWMTAIQFLTQSSTEGTVLGPFHTHEAEHVKEGSLISQDSDGEPLLVLCTLNDVNGSPIPGAKIDVWETDSKGFYDVQHADRTGPDGRAVLTSDDNGDFWFKAIVPVPYPIPHDGPVGKLLKVLGRHCYRPSHMHFMFKKGGYDPLITALYLKDDPYETTDAVFGVKDSLIVTIKKVEDEEMAKKYGVKVGSALMTYDSVLVSDEAAAKLRREKAEEAMAKLGRKFRFIDDLPVPDVD
ncbi:Intradiol ring-cleavage dioxygenase [Fusarium oxysporum f. sp. albedinis]|nr:Intradiol ring-cleavage dioxygenase [Fusarium oxysporum f. sp. albedinis]KAJ0135997.1 Uncharacterized protein HZ326_20976 [Fusarium oxysporum f. sp. albedinis]